MADMLDKLKQFLEIDGKNKIKLDIEISDKLPSVLYGDESGVIKTILYFFDLIVSISNKKSMSYMWCKASHICSDSSKSSPVPAAEPMSFGACISMIVVHCCFSEYNNQQ